MNNEKIGVAVVASGIERSVVSRSEAHIPFWTRYYTKPVVGPFNLARARNAAIRGLLQDDVRFIASVDVDCVAPESTYRAATAMCSEGGIVVFCRTTTQSASCIDFESATFDTKVPGRGAFTMMRQDDWERVGGYDERCFGWGGEDNLLYDRCKQLGIQVVELAEPLVHVDHMPRPGFAGLPRGRGFTGSGSNYEVCKRSPQPVNYLRDRFERAGRMDIVVLNLLSRCQFSCKNCSNSELSGIWPGPDYRMSLEDVAVFIDATEASGYMLDVILSGGEPSLRTDLPIITRMLASSEHIKSISVFTNGARGDTLEKIYGHPKVSRIRLTRYPGRNDAAVARWQALPHVEVFNPGPFIEKPTIDLKRKAYGSCSCPYLSITGGRAFTCAGLPPFLAMADSSKDLQEHFDRHRQYWTPVNTDYMEVRRGMHAGHFPLCSQCLSCSANQ